MLLRARRSLARGRALGGRRGGGAFALYLLVSFAFFGARVVGHPEERVVGGLFTDPQIFIWSFAWWPHAVLHGENPFYTHAIWAPSGFNLTWATSVPGLAALFAPVTLLFGPVLAYNVASVLMPPLAAWTAFLLCRRLTGKLWPSLAGGYLFGFSSYVLGGELTHVFTVAVFLVPVAALLVLRFVQGDLSRRALLFGMAALLVAQMSISTELLFTLSLALAFALVLSVLLVPASRAPARLLLAPLAGAYALAGVVTAPFLYYVLSGTSSRPPAGAREFSADLLNVVVPTRASLFGWWTAGVAGHFPGNDVERGAYLGLPTIALVCVFAWQCRRFPSTRFLLAGFLLALLFALGPRLTIDGHEHFGLPWEHVAFRPFFENVMPVRLAMYATLAAAVMTALWAASAARPAWLRVVLPVAAILALVPNLGWQAWSRSPTVPALFATPLYKSCIGRGENVLLLPFGTLDDTLLWQVRSGFWFRVAGGYVSPSPPPAYDHPAGAFAVATENLPPKVTTQSVRQLVRAKGVTTIVLEEEGSAIWRAALQPLAKPQMVGGTLLYRLRGALVPAVACAAAARQARPA